MAISTKGRRKIDVEGTIYYWWINHLAGIGRCLNIASAEKDFILKVGTEGIYERVLQNVKAREISLPQGLDPTRMDIWQRPRAITPRVVRQLILLHRNPAQLMVELHAAIKH